MSKPRFFQQGLVRLRGVGQQVDLAIKELGKIDQQFGKFIDSRINSDEVKYSYVQPKKEVDLNGLKLKI